MATLPKGNFTHCNSLTYLPKLLEKKLQRAEEKKKPKREAKTAIKTFKKKNEGKARNWKEISIKLLTFLEKKKLIKFLHKSKGCMCHK